MRPMGRRKVKFPEKIDCHPKRGWLNWWEVEFNSDGNKKAERQMGKTEIKKQTLDMKGW